jgi:cyclic beta-1,2-glucan synthetase
MYRAGIESILGLQIQGDQLTVKPCVPPDWKSFKITYRQGSATYNLQIRIENAGPFLAKGLQLVDDGKNHEVTLVF